MSDTKISDEEDQDDTDALIDALHVMSTCGRLVLREAITINGIVYEPATYILSQVGPPPPLKTKDGRQ